MAEASGKCLPLRHSWDLGSLLMTFLTKVLFSSGTGRETRGREPGELWTRTLGDRRTQEWTPAKSLTRSSAASEPAGSSVGRKEKNEE